MTILVALSLVRLNPREIWASVKMARRRKATLWSVQIVPCTIVSTINNQPWEALGTRILALHPRPSVFPPVVFQTEVFFGYVNYAFYPSEQIGCVIMHMGTPLTNHSQAFHEGSNTTAYANPRGVCSSKK